MPALSSWPGQAPTHDARCLGDGNVAAVTPTSAMICCADSTPSPGDFGKAVDGLVMRRQQVRHLLIELAKVVLQQPQFFERQRQEPSIDGVERRTGLKRVGELRRRGP
jgi:hypothetical protein